MWDGVAFGGFGRNFVFSLIIYKYMNFEEVWGSTYSFFSQYTDYFAKYIFIRFFIDGIW